MLNDLISLIYPNECYCCNRVVPAKEVGICLTCRLELPETKYCLLETNPLTELFYGKVEVAKCMALYHFNKGGLVQKLMHQLKYNKKDEVGRILGREIAVQWQTYYADDIPDLIIPIPLHRSREVLRGFNQAAVIAEGVSDVLDKPYSPNALLRMSHNSTQTNKAVYERWENVKDIFSVTGSEELADKHILLVDDVITTGATLTAAIGTLQSVKGLKVSVAAVACA